VVSLAGTSHTWPVVGHAWVAERKGHGKAGTGNLCVEARGLVWKFVEQHGVGRADGGVMMMVRREHRLSSMIKQPPFMT
jgi:hypothetical protein